MLADAVEALIAAIYLDGGHRGGARIRRCATGSRVAQCGVDKQRDPKTELQEWAHRPSVAPAYEIESREGPDHDPVFTVSVPVAGFEPATGNGRSQREAEQAAAAAFLLREGVWTDEKD